MALRHVPRPLRSQDIRLVGPLARPTCRQGHRSMGTATATAETESSVLPSTAVSVGDSPASVAFKIMSGLILCRQPIVTPELTPFERAYYNYQSELQKRLMWTFPRWFYYPEGTLAERQFSAVQPVVDGKDRAEFEKPDIVFNRDRRSKQEVVLPERDVERETEESAKIYAKIEPRSRITEADTKDDFRSLERKLDRTLYLLVKKDRRENAWKFPAAEVLDGETLTGTAARLLLETGGPNMNTWLVSNTPAAYHRYDYKPEDNEKYEGAKIFYLKSRIFAGTFIPQKGSGIVDYAWLTKDEIQHYVHRGYWASMANALSRQ
ncbi:39S mitochondrial ribosomal protein L46-domain-containing protein [Lipomyces kononenkoae]|uniref:39S mitochondrial ribosomal protein L46-domain-containing protein n=1 Tax=Lipomyces kononenkoae TaxID=34357 RepID=A0ACC3SXQ6_LIPKO